LKGTWKKVFVIWGETKALRVALKSGGRLYRTKHEQSPAKTRRREWKDTGAVGEGKITSCLPNKTAATGFPKKKKWGRKIRLQKRNRGGENGNSSGRRVKIKPLPQIRGETADFGESKIGGVTSERTHKHNQRRRLKSRGGEKKGYFKNSGGWGGSRNSV